LIEHNHPDCLLIAETACSQKKRIIVPHDEYIAHYIPVDTDDENKALGNGMALITPKNKLTAHPIK
jgi:hypothetical protein